MILQEWFGDRELLITGITSEVGRALLEKILRSFPRVKVHVVLRSRYGATTEMRIKKIFASPGFERLRQEDPNAISRVRPLEGNLLYEDLGLNKEERQLMKEVSVVFHAAGPHLDVLEFCEKLPNLEAVVAVFSLFKYKGQISESLLNEKVPNVPLALVRLPFTGPACGEPMPGYVEILKAPAVLMIGAGFALGDKNHEAQIIPIDIAINNLIAAAWERGMRNKSDAPRVYNVATIGCTWGKLLEKGKRANKKFTYPSFGFRGMTTNTLLHWSLINLFGLLPSIICDMILSVFGAKRRVVAEFHKVQNALHSLELVSLKTWSIDRSHIDELQERLCPRDQELFPLTANIDLESYIICAANACKKYCVNEDVVKVVQNFKLFFLISFILIVLCIIYSM